MSRVYCFILFALHSNRKMSNLLQVRRPPCRFGHVISAKVEHAGSPQAIEYTTPPRLVPRIMRTRWLRYVRGTRYQTADALRLSGDVIYVPTAPYSQATLCRLRPEREREPLRLVPLCLIATLPLPTTTSQTQRGTESIMSPTVNIESPPDHCTYGTER